MSKLNFQMSVWNLFFLKGLYFLSQWFNSWHGILSLSLCNTLRLLFISASFLSDFVILKGPLDADSFDIEGFLETLEFFEALHALMFESVFAYVGLDFAHDDGVVLYFWRTEIIHRQFIGKLQNTGNKFSVTGRWNTLNYTWWSNQLDKFITQKNL